MNARRASSAAALAVLVHACAAAGLELAGFVGAEARGFVLAPAHPAQGNGSVSFVARPELYRAWNDGRDSLLVTPFVRLDTGDPRRTHADLREALWQRLGEAWELRVGVGQVFWGVTESQHLVDIVNQTDLVENIDGEDKLGQPMVNLNLAGAWGALDLFVLPGFRERTFPGREGRLRTEPAVDTDRPSYESSAGNLHVDLAARWSRVIGLLDVGLYHFYGTSRDPRLLPLHEPGAPTLLIPRYDLIHQSGLDAQLTAGQLLVKLEAIRRVRDGESFHALAGGVEYTVVGALGSRADVGLLAEYLYDDRDSQAPVVFEDDVFVGLRLTANDTQSSQLLAGVIVDREDGSRVWSVEVSRRIGDRWRLELEARAWDRVKVDNPMFTLRRDDYVQVSVSRYF
jgi:hypothetical protein